MGTSNQGAQPTPYEIGDVTGEMSLGAQGPIVGRLQSSGYTQRLRSLPYVDEHQSELHLDLDWYRYERIEEYRQGKSFDFWLQLWARAFFVDRTDEARIEGFAVRVPQEDWLVVHTALTGQSATLLEVRYNLLHADRYKASLQELRTARDSVDQGDYFEAVVRSRKAILLLEPTLRTEGEDLKQALARLVDDRHADIYASFAARLKDMGNVQVHSGNAPGYTRSEALFAVHATEQLCELFGSLASKPRRGSTKP